MSFTSLIFLAFAMSADAFAAAIGKGATLHKPRLSEALRTGLIFGVIEAITPVIGWALGYVAAQYIERWDHWIAFTLLIGLGLRMIWEGIKPEGEAEEKPRQHGFWLLVATAFATSIDAMAVGVSLAFISVNIIVAALFIGCATLLMVTLGVMLGRVLGNVVGRRAELAGGVILIVIGALILHSHLTEAASRLGT